MKDLKTRVISGVIGLIILIGILKIGGLTLQIGVGILSLIGLKELYRALEAKGFKPVKILGYGLSVLFFILYYFKGNEYMDLFISISIMSLLLSLLTEKFDVRDVALTLLSILYVPFLMNHIALLSGTKYIWLIFIIAFGTDTFAYFAGNFFGKKKLCPSISPNKTVEGFIGGILGSVILTIIYTGVYLDLGILSLIPLAVVGAMISQSGDLVASTIKRYTGIKDYGNLIPGHGGVMDRFDSIMFTAPVVYYYTKLFLI